MLRTLPAALLVALVAAAPAASAFPGDHSYTGKMKCVTTYNGGSSGPFTSTDVVTLSFIAVVTDVHDQAGTVVLTHTETSAAGIDLDDDDPMTYHALVNPEETNVGLLAVHDDDGDVSAGFGEFKRKADGSVTSIRFVSIFSAAGTELQRCSGTLKLDPVT
jgi:hypothetical protein